MNTCVVPYTKNNKLCENNLNEKSIFKVLLPVLNNNPRALDTLLPLLSPFH